MERGFVWKVLWLEVAVLLGLANGVEAAMPPDVWISDAAEAQAFSVDEPFIFDGQTLKVSTSFATDRDFWLESQAFVDVTPGVRFDLAGQISAAPQSEVQLHKSGQGALHVSGDNGYHGITFLREGVLHISGSTALGNRFYPVEQVVGTELSLDAGASLENFIQIRPVGSWQALPGVEGVAQWRVDEGVASFKREVNSLHPIRKVGAGTLRLQDMVMGQADLLVQEGALSIEAMADARVTVAAGARLEGTGQMAFLQLQQGGMLAPAGTDGVGALTVWGDAHFDAGSRYHVNAKPDGRADMLWVGGMASLDGTVQAQAAQGDWAEENRYRILNAQGGLGGSEFAQVETDLAFLEPKLEYDAHNVYLSLQRNDTLPGDLGQTPEEEEVGDAITPSTPPRKPRPRPEQPSVPAQPETPNTPETPQPEDETSPQPEDNNPPQLEVDTPTPQTPDSDEHPKASEPVKPNEVPNTASPATPESSTPLFDAMQGMSVAQVRSLLRQSTGDWHASLRSFMLEDGRHVRQAVLNSGRDGNPQTQPHTGNWRSWAQAYTSSGRRSAAAGIQGDSHHSHGVVLGWEAVEAAHRDGWRPGLVLAAQSAHLKRPQGQAAARTHNLHVGLTARRDWDGMRITAALLRTWHRINSERRVMAGPLREIHKAGFTGRSWQMLFEFAPDLQHLLRRPDRSATVGTGAGSNPAQAASPGLNPRPYLRHEWVRLTLPAYQESGGLSAHGVDASGSNMHASTLGVQLSGSSQTAETPMWWEADMGWRHIWGDGQVHSTQHFLHAANGAEEGRRFSSRGRPLARDALSLSLAAGVAPGRNARLSLRYAGLYGGGYRDHAAWADLRWSF